MYEVGQSPQHRDHDQHGSEEGERCERRLQGQACQKAKFIDEEKCTGCGECMKACPVTVPHEMDGKVGGIRKLIYMPFPRRFPTWRSLTRTAAPERCGPTAPASEGAVVDCSQCRECPIALCVAACKKEGKDAVRLLGKPARTLISDVKSIVVASVDHGAQPPKGLHGYDVYDNVITYLQFEEADECRWSHGRAHYPAARTRSTTHNDLRGFAVRGDGAWITERPTAPRYAAWSPTNK